MLDSPSVLIDPDVYLDRRVPEWTAMERAGFVRYDSAAKAMRVSVAAGEIVTRLSQNVTLVPGRPQ